MTGQSGGLPLGLSPRSRVFTSVQVCTKGDERGNGEARCIWDREIFAARRSLTRDCTDNTDGEDL